MPQLQFTKLGAAKVLSSGLTPAAAAKLGMYEVVSAATLHKAFEARPALALPYFGVNGKPLPQRPGWPPFYRVRYLDEPKFDFKQAAGDKKPPKYMQPPGTLCRAYFPLSMDWPAMAKDPQYPIIITEGELKAAAGCQAGFNVIGLGGVWSFKAMGEGVLWLPELEEFDWVRRRVHICYDSDYVDNPKICKAINGLCEELQERGALVRLVTLPPSEEEKAAKVGIDDYFQAGHTAEDFQKLLDNAEPLGMSTALWKMNDELVYVAKPGLIVTLHDKGKLGVDPFKSHSDWTTLSAVETIVIPASGNTLQEKTSAAALWLKWPLRTTVKALTYAPGKELFTETDELNLWPGWGVEPEKGPVTPWLELTRFLFKDTEPNILEYFYDWCAYPIQNPGTKMFVGVVVHGTAQGTGKTLLGHTLGRIYGENYLEIDDDDLEETDWADNKQFILGDEVSGKDSRAHTNKLKRLITKPTVRIDIKYVPRYVLPNCMNFLFTSNYGDSFFLEDKDRRFLIVEVKSSPQPEKFYKDYDAWYKGPGAAHLFQWLLDRKINKDFNPMNHAPDTAAKKRMIHSNKGELAGWVSDLKENTDAMLRMGQMRYTKDLFSAQELFKLYEQEYPNNSRVTAKGLGRQLSAADFHMVANGQPLKSPQERMVRYYAIRNAETWLACKDRKKLEANLKLGPVKE